MLDAGSVGTYSCHFQDGVVFVYGGIEVPQRGMGQGQLLACVNFEGPMRGQDDGSPVGVDGGGVYAAGIQCVSQ
jgi:hypothetical protein